MDEDQTHLSHNETTPSHATDDAAYNPFADAPDDFGFVGNSLPIRAVRDAIRRYAKSRASVLIEGETGTGKELAARAVGGRCVAVNAATLRGTLLADELSGHVRGAFTGAIAPRRGLLEIADGGTLFVDEVGELDLVAQAELLRVIETGEVRPIGSERVRTVHVRIVAATHRDLVNMVRAGTFREDLFNRLCVLPLMLPPLRDHVEDLPALVTHLLDRLAPDVGPRTISDNALIRLAEHRWPGNVRELLHVRHRAAVTTDSVALGAGDVARILDRPNTSPGAGTTPTLTDNAVQTALQLSKGSVSGAAKLLGIPRSTLRDRLVRSGVRTS